MMTNLEIIAVATLQIAVNFSCVGVVIAVCLVANGRTREGVKR